MRFTVRAERRQPSTLSVSYDVQLPANRPSAGLALIDDHGNEKQQAIPLALDTLIIEPDLDRYMVVWRGGWKFMDQMKERYLKLSVSGGI